MASTDAASSATHFPSTDFPGDFTPTCQRAGWHHTAAPRCQQWQRQRGIEWVSLTSSDGRCWRHSDHGRMNVAWIWRLAGAFARQSPCNIAENQMISIISLAVWASTCTSLAADQSSVVERAADEYFGAITTSRYIIGQDAATEAPIAVYLFEAHYTEYDRLQARGRLDGQTVVAGVLVNAGAAIQLSGTRSQGGLHLIDVDLLLDRQGIASQIARERLAQPQRPFNNTVERWRVLVERLRRDDGVLSLANTRHFASQCGGIHLYLSDDAADRLEGFDLLDTWEPAALAEGAKVERRTLLGETDTDGIPHDVRLVTFGVSSGGGDVSTIAIQTYRAAERRVVGALPEQVQWPSRFAMVWALQDVMDAQTSAAGNLSDEATREIIERHRGKPLSWPQFRQDLELVFGCVESAIDAACPFAEVAHDALAAADRNALLEGSGWYLLTEESEESARQLVTMRAVQIALPQGTTAGSEIRLRSRHIHHPDFSPFTVRIRAAVESRIGGSPED